MIICWRARGDDLAAVLAAFGTQIDDPVGGADHIEVVLDDQQRMAGLEQQAEGAHQARDVLEMQSGGGLIEQQQLALAGGASGAARAPCVGRAGIARPGGRRA